MPNQKWVRKKRCAPIICAATKFCERGRKSEAINDWWEQSRWFLKGLEQRRRAWRNAGEFDWIWRKKWKNGTLLGEGKCEEDLDFYLDELTIWCRNCWRDWLMAERRADSGEPTQTRRERMKEARGAGGMWPASRHCAMGNIAEKSTRKWQNDQILYYVIEENCFVFLAFTPFFILAYHANIFWLLLCKFVCFLPNIPWPDTIQQKLHSLNKKKRN